MKKTVWAAALTTLLCAGNIVAQDTIPSVEKSIVSIQIGEGLMFTYEHRLSRTITLRAEAGVGVMFIGEDEEWLFDSENTSLALLPTFAIEPRWYYNLDRRVRKGKAIARNRANYFSLYAKYAAGWGAVELEGNMDEAPSTFAVVPMWGLRRTLGKHFNYELGAGLGYAYVSKYDHFKHYHGAKDGVIGYLRARFGFDF